MVKKHPANAGDSGDVGLIPGSGASHGEGNGHLLQYFLPGKSHGQRSLMGYSPWGCKESDLTDRLIVHLSITCLSVYLSYERYVFAPYYLTESYFFLF